MNLEVLVSTMDIKSQEENIKLIRKMNLHTNTLTISQIENLQMEKDSYTEGRNRLIIKNEKGLSKSRNTAIDNAKFTICVLADDDVTYCDDFEKIIEKEYEKDNKADIICFFVESNNRKRKVKRMISSRIGKIRAMRVCSFQITFKRESVVNKKIKFNENFGIGTYYGRGEETIFLWECIDKGLKVKFVNKKIADVDQNSESSWFKGYNKDYFITQGAIFCEMSPKTYKFLILQFIIRKYNLYKGNLKMKEAFKCMIEGANEYKRKT